jgi:hypothetical protein
MPTDPVLPNKKIYQDNPGLGPIMSAIKNLQGENRRVAHHRAVVQEVGEIDEFTLQGIRVVPTSPVHIDSKTGSVEIRCFAFDVDTGEEIPHIDGRFQFEQPTLVVANGTWRKEENPGFGEQDVPNVVEDIPQAFRLQLVRAIRSAAGMSPEV